ncbi:conjugal transfer protein [Enterococcus hirae]
MIFKRKNHSNPSQPLPIEKKGKKESYKGARKRRFLFLFGWGFLVFSVGFGIYNNLTSKDTHTIHETKVIDKQLKDTSGLENYVKNFAYLYFTISKENEQMMKRNEALESYLAEGVLLDNEVDKEINSTIQVKNVSVWSIEEDEKDKDTYIVTFHVSLDIGKEITERVYTISVYCDQISYAVVKLPVLASNVKKASIKVDNSFQTTAVSQEKYESLEKFLRIFFSIYPKANDEELKYYGQEIQAIKQPYSFEELNNLQLAEKDNAFQAQCIVVYKDEETHVRMTMNYELEIKELSNGNFRIEAID